MELRKVDENNIWKLIKLKVAEGQTAFVATNTESLLEAYINVVAGDVALPFGLYEGEEPVGFVMIGYGSCGDEDEPEIAQGNYNLWRFMIDERYQRRGLGRKALAATLEYLRTRPCGAGEYCWLSYEPENTVAAALYHEFGFQENGQMCCDEIVAVCKL